jgi:tetratricopeptide (TPR) repeat protein
MRASYKLERFGDAYDAADKVLHTEKINDREKREAHFIKAKVLFEEENFDRALDEFRLVAGEDVNSSEGAEAKYHVALIYFSKKDYKVAESEVFDFIQQNSSQEYWKAKSYILLADVFNATGDAFQAKHTLRSIIENYDPVSGDDDIQITARKKYNEILEQEKYQMQMDSMEEQLNIRMEGQ